MKELDGDCLFLTLHKNKIIALTAGFCYYLFPPPRAETGLI